MSYRRRFYRRTNERLAWGASEMLISQLTLAKCPSRLVAPSRVGWRSLTCHGDTAMTYLGTASVATKGTPFGLFGDGVFENGVEKLKNQP